MTATNEKRGRGYLKRAVNNQWITLGRLMVGRTFSQVLENAAIRPVYSSIMVTQNCNYKCVMCSFWHRHTENELTVDEVGRVARELREMGVAQLNFTGGEPFLRQDFEALIHAAATSGFTMMQTTTNASLATPERLTAALSAGLGRIAISCDGIGENHDAQRGVPNAWRKNLASLDTLRALRTKRFPRLELEIAMVITRRNIADLPAILRVCDDYGAVLHLQFLDNVQFFTAEVDIAPYVLSDDDVDTVMDEVHRQITKSRGMDPLITHTGVEYIRRHLKRQDPERDMPRPSCGVGYAMCYIDSVGNVYPGCFAIAPLGNVREQPLTQIVDSERHRRVSRDMFQMNCPRCPNGYAWGVFTNPQALIQELGTRVGRRLG